MKWDCTNINHFLILQWNAFIRIQDGGKWPTSMTSQLGDQTIERLTKQLEVEEGDIIALAAGDGTKPVSLFCEIFLLPIILMFPTPS